MMKYAAIDGTYHVGSYTIPDTVTIKVGGKTYTVLDVMKRIDNLEQRVSNLEKGVKTNE